MFKLDYLSHLADKGGPNEDEYEELTNWFSAVAKHRNTGTLAPENIKKLWENAGEAFSIKTLQGFAVQKPYGYAGDFEIIDKIYTHWISPEPHLTKWDHYFHACKATQAVRNRKSYFLNLLSALEKKATKQQKILIVGSGPARDIYEYCTLNPRTALHFYCLDIDERAITYAQKLCANFLDKITFIIKDIFRFKSTIHYDLIWSAGLFDYLDDKVFSYLLNKLLNMIDINGQLVVGNFSPINPDRNYMEFGDWYLHYRNENKLKELAELANAGSNKVKIGSEKTGVNLFLHLQKKEFEEVL